MKCSSFTYFAAAVLSLPTLTLAWQVQTFLSDDNQTCSGPANETITDVAPGDCVPVTHPVNSVLFQPYVGNGPFTGTGEIDFYPSKEECEGDYNCSLLYGFYDLDEGDCWNAEVFDSNAAIQYYKVWKR